MYLALIQHSFSCFFSYQWLNDTERPEFTLGYSQTADSATAMFLLLELTEFYSYV
jgi:hypothetical protein